VTKRDLLKQVKEEVLNLKKSPLYEERIKSGSFPVIGEGSHEASVMFIGEAPGAREAKTGRPFCGSAGKILDECLEAIQLKREDVYITNILKDRPPGNRDPLEKEIEIYTPFLDRQIKIINPKIIVTLGRFSADYILRKYKLEEKIKPITALHGKPICGEIMILPLFHPAVAIYNRSKKDVLKEGFFVLKNMLIEIRV
jgi:uracil-DNA glycosylase